MSTLPSLKSRKERTGGHLTTSSIGLVLVFCTLLTSVSCRGEPSNGNFVASESEQGYNKPQGDDDNEEFGWDLSTDNVEFYKVIHGLDLEEIVTFLENASNHRHRRAAPLLGVQRYRRSTIFGKDNRKKVSTSMEAQMMPYVASVKISSQCSGTLIGPKHVLTAAHCAFKGIKRTTKRKLKVGFLQRNGKLRWKKVRKVRVSHDWNTIGKIQDRMKHDYAVLELKRAHRRPFMRPVPFHSHVQSVLRFNGFPGDKKPNTMWHTHCPASRPWRGYLINHCAATKGTSGAGSYQSNDRLSYTVRGLVVASVSLRKGKKKYRFNVINPLTREKTRRICRWMKAGNDCKYLRR